MAKKPPNSKVPEHGNSSAAPTAGTAIKTESTSSIGGGAIGSGAIASGPIASGPIAAADLGPTGPVSAEESPDTLDSSGVVMDGPRGPHGPQMVPAEVHLDPKQVISSSSWTGKKSLSEQVETIQMYAGLCLIGVGELQQAIEAKRLNEPQVQDLLTELRALHDALGTLLEAAALKQPADETWHLFEKHKAKILGAILQGGKLMVVAPIQSVGAAIALGGLSGIPVDSTLLAGAYGATAATSIYQSSKKG